MSVALITPQEKKYKKLIFLGLDNAGKTTLLRFLRDGRITMNEPTIHPNQEDLIIGNIKFTTHDLGGHDSARALWKTYFTAVDGIVFIVDALDRDRFPESKRELDALMTDDSLADVPILVLGNKIDVPQAASEEELRAYMGLRETYGKSGSGGQTSGRPLEVFMCSVLRGQGFKDGFQWLNQFY